MDRNTDPKRLEEWEEVVGRLEEVDEGRFETRVVIGDEEIEIPSDIELTSEPGITVGIIRTDTTFVVEVRRDD